MKNPAAFHSVRLDFSVAPSARKQQGILRGKVTLGYDNIYVLYTFYV